MQNIRELKNNKFCWLNIEKATHENLHFLKQKFNFESEDLNDCAPIINRQKVNARKNYIFAVVQFPYYEKTSNSIRASEIDFFIAKKFLITVHDGLLKPLNDFFALCQTDQLVKSKIADESVVDFFHKINQKIYQYCYVILNQVNLEIERIEEEILLVRPEEKTIVDILTVKRNVVNFLRITQSHKKLWQKISREMKTPAVAKAQKNFHNLINNAEDIGDYLQNYKETINALHETQSSITTLKINKIMKTLTIFSVIVFPLTLFAAIFGMNTINSMPWVDHKLGFWYIIALMFIGMTSMLAFFKYKKWI